MLVKGSVIVRACFQEKCTDNQVYCRCQCQIPSQKYIAGRDTLGQVRTPVLSELAQLRPRLFRWRILTSRILFRDFVNRFSCHWKFQREEPSNLLFGQFVFCRMQFLGSRRFYFIFLRHVVRAFYFPHFYRAPFIISISLPSGFDSVCLTQGILVHL